ncbi:hypothetical protein CJF32_00002810 [Rutstroemia sp. NJR-2017a WRK4]|nr:hypothetical protein CJF32_00002810 [Rutstroemia sp. NJR-2017a WRK4]
MAPLTRSRPFRTPTPEPLNGKEADTPRKSAYFVALACDGGKKAYSTIAKECNIVPSTARDWRYQYENMGTVAKRYLRPRSKILGRKSKVTKSMCKMLVSPSRNPVRKQPLEAQIAFHKLPVKPRQLGRKLYLCAFIQKEISEKNRADRTTYSETHLYDPVFGFWDYVVFTDKAYVDPTSKAQGRVLREQGTCDRPENIEERPLLKGVCFHIAAWISWWGKAEKLRFYNNEQDKIEKPPIPPKPRRYPTTEIEEDYRRRIAEWEASKPYTREVKVQGNAMTQKYYYRKDTGNR